MKRGIHYVPCQWCTDRRLLQEVMAYCLNFLILQLTMTQKSAVCTTCHFNRVIRSHKSVSQSVIYVTTAVNTSIFEHFSVRSEEHTSELQLRGHLVCRLLLEKKKHKQL